MTYRSRAGLKTFIDQMVPSNQTSEVSAADIRGLLNDMVDSYKQGPEPPLPWWLQRFESAFPTPGPLDIAQLTAAFTEAYMRTGVRSETYRATFPVATSVAGYVAVLVPVSYLPFQSGYPTLVGAFSPVFL